MKKFISLVALCSLLFGNCLLGRAQTYFYESFNQVPMNGLGVGDVPSVFTLYNDHNTPYTQGPDLSYFKQAWQVIRSVDGQGYAASLSFFKETHAANRWIISPAVQIPTGSKPILSFRAMSADKVTKDGLKVMLSTTTNDSSAFTVALKTLREVPGEWTSYTLDLSDYAGKTVYIAFLENSKEKFMIYLDDLRISNSAKNDQAACNNAYLPMYMVYSSHANAIQKYPIRASLFNTGNNPIRQFTLCYQVGNEPVVSTPFNEEIQALEQKIVQAYFTPQWGAGDVTVKIWFSSINGSSEQSDIATRNTSIVLESEVPHKTLLLEIFSSAMCSNCGPENAALHRIMNNLHANDPKVKSGFVATKYQVDIPTAGDPMVTPETLGRGEFYGIVAAPSLYMNGFRMALGTEEDQKARIEDSLKLFQATPSPLHLSMRLSQSGSTFSVDTRIESILPCIGNYTLYVNLMVDSIHQRSAQMSGEKDFFNVVRKMLPNKNGTSFLAPLRGDKIEKTFSFTFDGTNPKVFADLSRVVAVTFIQNNDTREIIQAAYTYPDTTWTKVEETKQAVRGAFLFPNPAQDKITLGFQALANENLNLSLFDMQGHLLRCRQIRVQLGMNTVEWSVSDLKAGYYLIQLEGSHGISYQKLLKK